MIIATIEIIEKTRNYNVGDQTFLKQRIHLKRMQRSTILIISNIMVINTLLIIIKQLKHNIKIPIIILNGNNHEHLMNMRDLSTTISRDSMRHLIQPVFLDMMRLRPNPIPQADPKIMRGIEICVIIVNKKCITLFIAGDDKNTG